MMKLKDSTLYVIAAGVLLLIWTLFGHSVQGADTIAQIKASQPQSLWAFLLAIPGSFETQIVLGLMIGALVGMAGHYARQLRSDAITCSPWAYIRTEHPWRTVAALISMVGVSVIETGFGVYSTDAGQFVGWAAVIMSGIKTGYGCDSLVNKAKASDTQLVQAVGGAAHP